MVGLSPVGLEGGHFGLAGFRDALADTEESAIFPAKGAAGGAVDVDFESARCRQENAFGAAVVLDAEGSHPGIADLASFRGDVAMSGRVVGRQRSIRRELLARIDQVAFNPDRFRIEQQHRNEIDGVRVVFDQISGERHHRIARLADRAICDLIAQPDEAAVVAAQRAPVEGDVVAAHRFGNAVGFFERGAEPLFGVDAAHAILGGEDDRLGSRKRRRRDTDDVRLLFKNHFAIVEIGVGNPKAL